MKISILALTLFLSFTNSGQAVDFKLIGKAMLEFSIFKIDVYEISYYKAPDGQEKLQLVYQRDIKKEHSIQGWEEGMKPLIKQKPNLKPKFQWFVDNTLEMKKGDKFEILRKAKDSITLIKNGKVLAQKNDKELYEMGFYPWLGAIPVDKDLKDKLLNKN